MRQHSSLQDIKWPILACLLLFGLVLASCRPDQDTAPDELSGTVILWHDLGEDDTLVLEQVISNFAEINPEVKVETISEDPSELRWRFETAVDSGLGPDLLLGSSSWIMPLADSARIRPLDGLIAPEFWDRYLPAAVATTKYDGQFYAIPESLRMMGLYYNKRLVDKPPTMLDGLLEQVAEGKKIGMSSAFSSMFWGIRAFGGELMDEDGQIMLDQGGFANWLGWLATAQPGPNFLIDRDRQTLRTLFGDGELAYLVDGSWAAQELRNLVGEEVLGVASLPAGPIGPASPLLETNAFMLSAASSERQQTLAVELAKFITNPEQATTLMRRGDRIPASGRILVNPSVDPIAFPFIAQARNAIPYENTRAMDAVINIGAGAYNRALQGVEGPVEVADNISAAINQALGFPPQNTTTSTCQQLGVLEIWHSLDEDNAVTLQRMASRFREKCPNLVVQLSSYEPQALVELLTSGTTQLPELALISSQDVTSLAETESVRSLSGTIAAERLQAFQPPAVQSWLVGERPYGVPFSLELPALYYNRTLVDNPARTLDALIAEGTAELPTALNTDFIQANWGLPAFGGRLFDAERRAVLDEGGFSQWLAWLQAARTKDGAILDTDEDRLLERFLSGDVAYFVGGPNALASAEAALGEENVGLVRLPTGPVAEASPVLTSQGFVVPGRASDDQTINAMLFIEYATDVDMQTLLMNSGRKVPVNITVDYATDPAISVFLEQSQIATVYPNITEMAAVEEYGREAYAVIENDPLLSQEELDDLVEDITEAINVANGFPPSQPQQEDLNNEAGDVEAGDEEASDTEAGDEETVEVGE